MTETLDATPAAFLNSPESRTAGTQGSGAEPCYANGANRPEIKSGWGGARPGAGRKPNPPPLVKPLGLRWYVVETYPQSERRTAHDLARQGWRGYLPLQAKRERDRVLPHMFHKTLVPLFSGFVFVEFDRDSLTWGTIRELCVGVRGILRAPGSGRPAPLDLDFIPKLMAQDAQRLQLASVQNKPRNRGDEVRITEGALMSYSGNVLDCDGITTTVAVEMFGRTIPVEMAWDHVEVARGAVRAK